ncbi:type IV pilin protein [Candidatus Albibeggiatoa sp. nov. BB20]|uniref:type IV pilin protein n=1 Tax=Candidatus Albibeggiatoa sp. nov. BB20 TaxID=3162723 RepID=UPI00336547CB
MYKPSKGFTLIELMIAVAIMAILVAIAVPNYTSYLVKSRRADAKTSLMTIAQLQETYFADNNSYADGQGTAPFNTLRAKREGFELVDGAYRSKEGYYKLDFKKASATYFEVRATPIDMQAQGEDDLGNTCNVFLLDSRGKKNIELAPSANAQDCWN